MKNVFNLCGARVAMAAVGLAPWCAAPVLAADGSGIVNPAFVQKGTGAVARTVMEKLKDTISAKG